MNPCPDRAIDLVAADSASHAASCVPCRAFGAATDALLGLDEAAGCEEALALAWRWRDRGLTGDEERDLLAHLRRCDACAVALYADVLDVEPAELLAATGDAPAFRAPILDAAERSRGPGRAVWIAALAATAAVAFAVGRTSVRERAPAPSTAISLEEAAVPAEDAQPPTIVAPAGAPPPTSHRAGLLTAFERGCARERRRESISGDGAIRFLCVDTKGSPHGLFVAWNQDGESQRRSYHRGAADGVWTAWSATEKKSLVARFERGALLEVDGKPVKSAQRDAATRRMIALFDSQLGDAPSPGPKRRDRKKDGDPPTAEEGLPEHLTRSDIAHGIGEIKSDITACTRHLDEDTERAMVRARIRISAKGTIADVDATGGPPELETCVEAAVRRARFPETLKGMTVTYPFVMRP